jgi:hypothetical protein
LFTLTGVTLSPTGSHAALTKAQAYACEIQAYLIKVVLGLEGDPSMRQRWAEKGVKEPLDLAAIYDAMHGGKNSELDYMLLDYNLSDLLKVLFYYDPDLNLHRGSLAALSPYPSHEFVAMRLFLLKRLHPLRPLSLSRILNNNGMLNELLLSQREEHIAEAGLSREEAVFLKDVTASFPRILEYMGCPFLVRALLEAGILEKDALAEDRASKALYGPLRKTLVKGQPSAPRKVVFLPSFTRQFDLPQGGEKQAEADLKASQELLRLAAKLSDAIVAYPKTLASLPDHVESGGRLDMILQDTAFFLEDERPLAIHPGNAEETVKAVCPEATLTVILLGKNVRLSMHGITEPQQGRPWIFVDEMDAAYDQLAVELDLIARFLLESVPIRNAQTGTLSKLSLVDSTNTHSKIMLDRTRPLPPAF